MRVFLSYADDDRPWAQRLSAGLSKAGVEVLDPALSALPGDNLYLALGKALKRADAMVLVLSPKLLRSDRLDAELRYAFFNPRFKQRVSAVARSRAHAREAHWIVRHLNALVVTRDPATAAKRVAGQLLHKGSGPGSRTHVAS